MLKIITTFNSFESYPATKNRKFSQTIPPMNFPQNSVPKVLINSEVGINSPSFPNRAKNN